MPIPTYTPGYPPDGSSLGQTKSTIRNNLDGTFATLAIDHINNNGQPGSQPAGYHTVIHEVPQTNVTTQPGYNQVFSGVPGTLIVNGVTTPTIPPGGDQQLYSLTGGGVLSQLTGKVASANGYAWTGGVLIQWGIQSNAYAVVFSPAFTNLFSVTITPLFNGVGAPPITTVPVAKNAGTSGFSVQNNSGQTFSFYWLAIGN